MDNPFDDTAKSRYRRYFEQRGIRAISQYEVFALSRATDLVVECTEEDVKGLEVYGMALTIHEETWPYIDEFFRNVPDAMRKVPTFQEALEASERRGAVHNQQQTLILILRHRFGEIPDPVVQLIEATDDLAQLAKWLEQALDVNSLGAMGFISN